MWEELSWRTLKLPLESIVLCTAKQHLYHVFITLGNKRVVEMWFTVHNFSVISVGIGS